jgi:N-dimethylarginine dimethylaminohydrolase
MTVQLQDPTVQRPDQPLAWGRHYAMVRPDHFRVDYRINPYMDLDRQPDAARTMAQWRGLVAAIQEAGGRVDVLEQRADSPDMVYAMNLGLAFAGEGAAANRVVMSHMRYAARRREAETSRPWFAAAGFRPWSFGRDGVGAHFEAGDAFPYAGRLVVGYGPRTEELALKHLAAELDLDVLGVQITHPGMYHLDLGFCPLDERRALVCPAAFDAPGARALLDLVPEPIVLSETDALTFCANSIVLGRTLLMPACPPAVREQLQDAGFTVRLLDVSEFHKGGGSIRCLTNPLDVTLGRDLVQVAGGQVALPR